MIRGPKNNISSEAGTGRHSGEREFSCAKHLRLLDDSVASQRSQAGNLARQLGSSPSNNFAAMLLRLMNPLSILVSKSSSIDPLNSTCIFKKIQPFVPDNLQIQSSMDNLHVPLHRESRQSLTPNPIHSHFMPNPTRPLAVRGVVSQSQMLSPGPSQYFCQVCAYGNDKFNDRLPTGVERLGMNFSDLL